MTTAITAAPSGIAEFRSGVDALLEKRQYFIEKILPTLVDGKDYFVIKGRKSLGKAGAEKLASLFQLSASFEKDTETMDSLKGIDGLIAFKCTLSKNGTPVAEGRGAAILKEHNGNANTLIKICEKRAYVSAIIRATGLSDLFSQDLEDLPLSAIQPAPVATDIPTEEESGTAVMSETEARASLADDPHYPYERAEREDEPQEETEPPISERQRAYLFDLVSQHLPDGDEKERYTASIDGMTKNDASEAIRGLLVMAGR